MIIPTHDERLALLPNGRLIRAPAVRPHAMAPLPTNGYFVDRRKGQWVQVRDGRVFIMRGHRTIWRSTRRYAIDSANRIWAIEVGRSGIAYQIGRAGPLWVAAGHGPERRISTDEWPAMWTASDNLITVRRDPGRRFAYLLRDRTGRLLRILGSHLTIRALDTSAEVPGALLFWNAAGQLVWTDGAAIRVLADVASLGFENPPDLYPLSGGLIELLSRTWHEVILRSDGSVFARASAPTDGSVCCFGEQAAAADGSAVAYQLTDESSGATRVFVLRAGDERGRLVYDVARGKGLPPTWHDHWILFVDVNGKVVAIDASGGSVRTMDISSAIRRVHRANGEARRRYPHWSFASSGRLLRR